MATLKGVNLGGWLVLERWITPSLFKGVVGSDEMSFMRQLGEEGTRRLKAHHAKFITEADFAWIAAQGLNAVRIPVGWWMFGDEEPFIGCETILDKALAWSQKYKLRVLIDLHGLPGSQNGQTHSGERGVRLWHDSVAFQERSLWVVQRLTKRYAHYPAVWGIQVINEPSYHTPHVVLASYYQRALEVVRRHSPTVKVVLSDAFWGEGILPHITPFADKHTVLDVHLYQVYTPEDQQLTLEGHINKAQIEWKNQLIKLQLAIPTIVGEWSAAMSELYEPQAIIQKQYRRQSYARYAQAQATAFSQQISGWFYWTYKTERKDAWSLKQHAYLITQSCN